MRALPPGFALITGASSGLGSVFARTLPADRPLLLTGRDPTRLEALRGELAHGGRPVEILPADLGTDEGRQSVIELASTRPLALLVNNAGFGVYGPFLENDPQQESQMLQVNCLAPLALTRALAPRLLETARQSGGPQSGCRAGVILVSSVASFQPLPNFATYAASKAFLRYLGEALSQELKGQPLDCLTLCPGPTETAFFHRAAVENPSAFMQTPDSVVRQTLSALGRRDRVIPGWSNRLAATAVGLLPRFLARPAIRLAARRVLRNPEA